MRAKSDRHRLVMEATLAEYDRGIRNVNLVVFFFTKVNEVRATDGLGEFQPGALDVTAMTMVSNGTRERLLEVMEGFNIV